MSESAAAPVRRFALPMWVVYTITGFFGLLYAFAVWTAVSFLFSQATGPIGLNGMGWLVLILPVLFPILIFVAAAVLGARRRLLPFVLIMLTGLGVVGVFWLNVLAYSYANGASMLGS